MRCDTLRPAVRFLSLLGVLCAACSGAAESDAADAGRAPEDASPPASDGDPDEPAPADGSDMPGDGESGDGGPGDGDPESVPMHRVVGYLPAWRGVSNWVGSIGTSGLTHLVLAFANPESGVAPVLEASDADLARLTGAAHAAGTKVMISIGGGGGTANVTPLLAPDQADSFVSALVRYVLAHDLDGVDVDVEGEVPRSADYAPFVEKLGAALQAEGKLMTAALATWLGNDVAERALASFDFINVMSYDHCGSWTGPCEQSTYDRAVSDLATFERRGVPIDKLVLGVPFYAWCWGNCAAEALTYAELVAAYPDAPSKDWIDQEGAQLSYNGEQTLARKVELARSHGGVMIWELGQDVAGEGSLLRAIVSQLSAP